MIWHAWLKYLLPPVFPGDEEKTRTARMLYNIVLVTYLAAAVAFVYQWFIVKHQSLQSPDVQTILGAFAIQIAILVVLQLGYVHWGGILYVSSIWLLVSVAMFFIGGLQSPVGPDFIIIVTIAGLLLGIRGALAFAVLCQISLFAVLYAHGKGWVMSLSSPPDATFIAYSINTWLMAILSSLIAYNLQVANERLRAAAATMEAFVARLIHDLGPPVQGLLSVVSNPSWRDDQQQLRQMTAGQVTLLEAFVQQARAYVLARTITLQCAAVPLFPICLAAVDAALPYAQQRGIKIVQDIDVETPKVWGETTAIRRIFDNLLTNAVGVTPSGGEVFLSITQPTSALIEIVVQDQGPGIPLEKQTKIFEPYVSLQLSTLESMENRSPSPTGTGMGLGLAIVKELTTTLGGACGVTSEPGIGSSFYVRLPVAPEGGTHDHRASD